MSRCRAIGRALAAALILAVCLPAPHGRASWWARITYYTGSGVMADGNWVHEGAASCSYDLPLGTTVHLLDPDITVVCEDRGLLSATWIDVYSATGRPAWMTADWAEIETW